jgi:hypothetical protein
VVDIPDVTKVDNIHASVKYRRFMTDRYFDEPGVDAVNRTLLAVAAPSGSNRRAKTSTPPSGSATWSGCPPR